MPGGAWRMSCGVLNISGGVFCISGGVWCLCRGVRSMSVACLMVLEYVLCMFSGA